MQAARFGEKANRVPHSFMHIVQPSVGGMIDPLEVKLYRSLNFLPVT